MDDARWFPGLRFRLGAATWSLILNEVASAQMYAWSVASAQSERGPLDYQLKEMFMLQPPFDMTLDRVRCTFKTRHDPTADDKSRLRAAFEAKPQHVRCFPTWKLAHGR